MTKLVVYEVECGETFFEKETVVKPDAVRQPSAIPVEMLEGKQ